MAIITSQEKTKTINAWLKEGQIHWETKLPNGVIRTHEPLSSSGDILTAPTVVKLQGQQHALLWATAKGDDYTIDVCNISTDDKVFPTTSLNHEGYGHSSSLMADSFDNNIALAWINDNGAIETMQIAYDGKDFSVSHKQEHDFALPIENAQIRVVCSSANDFSLFFQTLDDNNQLSWAIKTPTQEAILQTDFHLGMGDWDMDSQGNVMGVTEILDEGLENKFFMIKLGTDDSFTSDLITAPAEVLEAQWPQVSLGNNEATIAFSARLQDNLHQTYYVESPLQSNHGEEPAYVFNPFGSPAQAPIETDNLTIISNDVLAGVMMELNSHDHLADLGFALQALSENYGNFSDFVHVDYNSDASMRIIQINPPSEEGRISDMDVDTDTDSTAADTFVLNPYNASQSILDFFDYIHTDFA